MAASVSVLGTENSQVVTLDGGLQPAYQPKLPFKFCSSVFGSQRKCLLLRGSQPCGLWLVFSVQNVPQTICFIFDRVREDFPLEIHWGVHQKIRHWGVERFVKDIQLASLFSRSGNLGPDQGQGLPTPSIQMGSANYSQVSQPLPEMTVLGSCCPRHTSLWGLFIYLFILTYSLYILLTASR